MANKNLSDLKNTHRRITFNIIQAHTCTYVGMYELALISIIRHGNWRL